MAKVDKTKLVQMARLSENGLTCREIASQTGVEFSTVARHLRLLNTTPEGEGKQFEQDLQGDQTLVITWAQNATPPHKGFLAALKNYCKRNKAQLVVIPGRYKNPTSSWKDSQKNEQYWHPDLEPYLLNQRKKLNANLSLLADVCVQPTAVLPLSGMESLSHAESCVFGHPKLQMRVIPTPHQRLPKIMTTTGAVTKENYTDTKAGKKGEFHHVYGAVVIERLGKIFHLRHINARGDGAFCDLDKAYYPDNTVKTSRSAGLVFGDIHVGACDPAVLKATFERLVPKLNPRVLVFHDLLDAYAVNPYHKGNPFITAFKRHEGLDDIAKELREVYYWLLKYADRPSVIVPSNHDNMLKRWLINTDWREDLANAEFYLETALWTIRNTSGAQSQCRVPDPFLHWIEEQKFLNVKALYPNQSYQIKGIECGLHGHEGPSGTRGTMKNLSQLGTKVISGHSHTPGIEAGHYRTGTMTKLAMEYTGPISSWLNAHVSIDEFGKRHIHTYVAGFWK